MGTIQENIYRAASGNLAPFSGFYVCLHTEQKPQKSHFFNFFSENLILLGFVVIFFCRIKKHMIGKKLMNGFSSGLVKRFENNNRLTE